MAPLAVIATKEDGQRRVRDDLAQGIRFERRLFHGLFGTEDQKEGMAAFVEKRRRSGRGNGPFPGKGKSWTPAFAGNEE
jgi:enoyl-CoA hydratase